MDFGEVVLVRLRLEVRPGFPDLDWHCHSVEINNGGQVQVFPCHKWLQTGDGDVELRSAEGKRLFEL